MKVSKVVPEEALFHCCKKVIRELDAKNGYLLAEVSYNNNLKSSGARIIIEQFGGFALKASIEINPTLPYAEFEETLKHEIAHLSTMAGDTEYKFLAFCESHDIPLHLKSKLDSEPCSKYKVVCKSCHNEGTYKRKGKVVKSLEEDTQYIACSCGGELLLYYKEEGEWVSKQKIHAIRKRSE